MAGLGQEVNSRDRTPIRRLAIACSVLLVANLGFRFLLATTLPLSYLEAYAWEWSRHLAFGYADDPALIAWLIRAVTELSDPVSILALRTVPLLLGSLSLLLVYPIAWELFRDRLTAWRALVLALCLPLVGLAGFVALPESPLVFFHLLSVYFLAAALRRQRLVFWLAWGVALGLALMSKLLALLLPLAFAGFLLGEPSGRAWLRRKEPWLGLGVALAVFAPFLAWNAARDWVTFRIQIANRLSPVFDPGEYAEYAIEQFANAPSLFILLWMALFVPRGRLPPAWDAAAGLLRWQSALPLGYFLAIAPFTETHPQWTITAYVPAAILLAAIWTAAPSHPAVYRIRMWVGISQLAIFSAVAVFTIGLPLLTRLDASHLTPGLADGLVKARQRMLGMPDLAAELERRFAAAGVRLAEVGTIGTGGRAAVFLFALDYEIASPLAFHWPHGPVVHVVPFVARRPQLGDAQRFMLSAEALRGAGGIFLATETTTPAKYFDGSREMAPIALSFGGRPTARYRVYAVSGFRPVGE